MFLKRCLKKRIRIKIVYLEEKHIVIRGLRRRFFFVAIASFIVWWRMNLLHIKKEMIKGGEGEEHFFQTIMKKIFLSAKSMVLLIVKKF